jgi:class 3 adenylate cyclase
MARDSAQIGTVTVMFTDMVGSTAATADRGTHAGDEVRRKLFALLRGAVVECGGTEVKNLGDGLMVTFSSAHAGVACAVRTQKRVARYNRRADQPLHVRVGLSVGDAVLEDGDWFGRPVVEAARLCNAAESDRILVTGAVRLMAPKHADAFSPLGGLELKGLSEPVDSYEVEWEQVRPDEPPVPLPSALATVRPRSFTARDRERARLRSTLSAAETGVPQVAVIAGEPGIGKTALAAEAAAAVAGDGAWVLYGRCEEDSGRPYEPFVDALDHLVEHCPRGLIDRHLAEHGSALARLVPRLRLRAGDLPTSEALDPESERYLLFGAVVGILDEAAEDQPLILVLDDLHWADRPSIQLLRHLVRHFGDAPVTVVGTYRATELAEAPDLQALLADISREESVTRIELAGLNEHEVTLLLGKITGQELDEEGERLAHAIQRETAGNPFFIRELVRNLDQAGALERTSGRLVGDTIELPHNVRDVILHRVARLGDDTRRTLSMAAVVGREFDVELLRRALEADPDELAEQLDAAVQAALLHEVPGNGARLAFPHALVEYTLYEALGPARRGRGHRQVAVALEAVHGDSPRAHVADLAYHYARSPAGEDLAKAVAYAVEAGDRALEQLAPDAAVRWYEQALELHVRVPGAGEPDRCDLLIKLGEAEAFAGLLSQRETLFEAAELARRLRDPQRLVRAAIANDRGTLYSKPGAVDQARVVMLEDALASLAPGVSPERAELLARLSNELHFAGEPERPRALSDEALSVARDIDAPDALIRVVAERALAIWSPDTLTERREEADEAVRAARRTVAPLARFNALRCRFLAAVCAADLAQAEADLADARALVQRVAHPVSRWFTCLMCSTLDAIQGRLESAEAFAEEGGDIAARSGQPDAEFVRLAQLAHVRYEQGRLGELRFAVAQMAKDFPGIPAWLGLLAASAAEGGDTAQASSRLERGTAAGFTPMDIAWGSGVGSYSIACARAEHVESAGALYRMMAPYEEQVAYTGANAWLTIAHHLGALARVLDRSEAAERHLRVAASMAERMRAPVWLARTRVEQARARLARGDRPDGVAPLLDEARETAARFGAAGVERDAADLLEVRRSVGA